MGEKPPDAFGESVPTDHLLHEQHPLRRFEGQLYETFLRDSGRPEFCLELIGGLTFSRVTD